MEIQNAKKMNDDDGNHVGYTINNGSTWIDKSSYDNNKNHIVEALKEWEANGGVIADA